jgi:hypothetical protein
VFCLVHGLLISGEKINSEDVSESMSYVRLFSLSVRFGSIILSLVIFPMLRFACFLNGLEC